MTCSEAARFGSLLLAVAFSGALGACGSEVPGASSYSSESGSNSGTASGVGGATGTGASGSGGPTGGGAVGNTSTDGSTPGDGLYLPRGDLPEARLHRLTRSELEHSLQDLLGPEVPIRELEPDSLVDGFSSIGASTVTLSPSGVSLHEQAVLAALGHVFDDDGRTSAQLPCVPENTADTTCLTEIVTRIGRRAFRRPLTDAEVQRFTGLATTIGDTQGSNVMTGVRHALSAILQSPSFLYRVELGAPSSEDGGKLKYTDFEMASRLAAVFWDSVPDDTLLDAAQDGLLTSVDGVRTQAERLLADPRSERSIVVLGREMFDVNRLEEAVKDTELFPTWRESLKDAMREELELRILDMVFTQQGDFLSLYDDRKTFVNDDLADFYGLPVTGQTGFYPAEFPVESKRAGLLGAGAVLAGHALPQRTSPTVRGKFVAERLLCRYVPLPPDNIPPLPAMAGPDATLRERLALHQVDPSCANCHALMDPMGFGMEDFDGVGLYRTMEGTSPVDATGTLTGEGLDGSSFDGLAELGAALRRQPVLGPCLVSRLYAEALGRRAVEPDRLSINDLAASFAASQNRVDQLLITLVTSEAFRFVEPRG